MRTTIFDYDTTEQTFGDCYIVMNSNHKYGLVGNDGVPIISVMYDEIYRAYSYLNFISYDKEIGRISVSQDDLKSYAKTHNDSFSKYTDSKAIVGKDIWIVKNDSGWGIINRFNDSIVPISKDPIFPLEAFRGNSIYGFIKILKDSKCGLLNSKAETVLDFEYKDIYINTPESDVAIVINLLGKWGLVSLISGEFLIPCICDKVDYYNHENNAIYYSTINGRKFEYTYKTKRFEYYRYFNN